MIQIILTSVAVLVTIVCLAALFIRRERRLTWFSLIVALSVTAALELFDLLAFLNPENLLYWKNFSLGAEGVLLFSWVLFTVFYARQDSLGSLTWRHRVFIAVSFILTVFSLAAPATIFYYSPDFAREHILFLGDVAYVFYTLYLGVLVVALINLESVLANASRETRWLIKFEIMGAGALLAVLIFYFSQGLLYRTINMNLMPLRSVALVTAAGLIAYSRLWRGSGTGAFVSHQMAFRSVVLFVVGLYLIGLGLLGEGMRYFGDSFQRSLLLAVGFLAGVALVVLLLSETAKRKIRVFLHKNFYRQKYDYRTQWLQFTDRLASAKTGDELLESIVRGFCETFGMGCGGLFLTEEGSNSFHDAALLELDPPSFRFGGEGGLIGKINHPNWVVTIPEALATSAGVERDYCEVHALQFAVPLLFRDQLGGVILLGRPLAREESYQYEDFDLMKTLARQASSAILNLRLADELSRAREMEAAGRISAFVLHDLKNLVSTLALVVENAREYIDNPEFQVDMLDSLDNTVTKMKGLMSRLKKLDEKPELNQETIDLLALADLAVKQIGSAAVQLSGEPVHVLADGAELQKVLLNLVLNSLEASRGSGPVLVTVGDDGDALIRVADQGCGMTEEFLAKRLFKPFTTTKEKGLGIGLYQCRQIVEAHGGKIEVQSEVNFGTTFTVRLPKDVRHGVDVGDQTTE